jgi:hypothetical protein
LGLLEALLVSLNGELVIVVLTAKMIGLEKELDGIHFAGCLVMILKAGCCDNANCLAEI